MSYRSASYIVCYFHCYLLLSPAIFCYHLLSSATFYNLYFFLNLFIYRYRSVNPIVTLPVPYLHLFGNTIISSLVRGSWRQFIGQIMTNYVSTKHSGISAKCSQQLLLDT